MSILDPPMFKEFITALNEVICSIAISLFPLLFIKFPSRLWEKPVKK